MLFSVSSSPGARLFFSVGTRRFFYFVSVASRKRRTCSRTSLSLSVSCGVAGFGSLIRTAQTESRSPIGVLTRRGSPGSIVVSPLVAVPYIWGFWGGFARRNRSRFDHARSLFRDRYFDHISVNS